MTKSQVYFKTDPSRSMDYNKDLYTDEKKEEKAIPSAPLPDEVSTSDWIVFVCIIRGTLLPTFNVCPIPSLNLLQTLSQIWFVIKYWKNGFKIWFW